MNKIKVTFYNTLILTLAFVFSTLITFLLGLFCKNYLDEKEGQLIFYMMSIICILQIPTIIFIINHISKRNDYFIDSNEIIQNNIVLFNKHDIISIKRKSLLKVEIKYNKDNVEKSIYFIATNKKLADIKALLCIYD